MGTPLYRLFTFLNFYNVTLTPEDSKRHKEFDALWVTVTCTQEHLLFRLCPI